jgi:hypothetical protein
MVTSENPSFVGGDDDQSGDDMRIALGSGASTVQVAALERLLVAREEALVAKLRVHSDQGKDDELLSEMVSRGVMTRLAECPTNWHLCTVFFASSKDPEDAQKAPWFFAASAMMVLAQVCIVAGVFMGTVGRSCKSSAQCDDGSFCWLDCTLL